MTQQGHGSDVEPEGVPAEDDLSAPFDESAFADDLAEGGPPPPTIFVTDPTVEAARVEWALRARRYEVIDVPLAMLAGRVAVQRPQLVLLDVDAPGALETAARVRQLPGASGVHLIYAGIAGKTFQSARDAFAHEGSGFFARPIDIEALIAKIDSLLGVEPLFDPSGLEPARPSSSPPPSLRAPPSPLPPRPSEPNSRPPSEVPPSTPKRHPSAPPFPPPASLPAELEGAAASLLALQESGEPGDRREARQRSPEARLSPDLERLLREAEARVGGPSSTRGLAPATPDDELLSPEDEVEAVLPAEILASLDEPLDLDLDDDDGGSETGGTSGASRATTGRGVRARSAVDARTSAGREVTQGGEGDPAAVTTSGGMRARSVAQAFDAEGRRAEGPSSLSRADSSPPSRRERPTSAPPPISPSASGVAGGATGEAMPGGAVSPATGSVPPFAPSSAAPSASLETRPPPRPRASLDDLAGAHPPPLAPQTARPPAPRVEAEPPPVLAAEPPPPRTIASADDALRALAAAVASRWSGVLRFDEAAGIRRVVLQDGDVVTAASSVDGESLLGFLVGHGDLPAEIARRLEGRVPPFGRLAGAALVAHGHLHQDQLWDVLQSHAAWLLGRSIAIVRGRVAFEPEAPQRLRGEPPVFGGTPGPALVVEIVRRTVPPAEAIARLGGDATRLSAGAHAKLLDECGLEDVEEAILERAAGLSLGELVAGQGAELAPIVYAAVALGILEALAGIRAAPRADPAQPVELADPLRDAELDDAAVRARISARRALAEDGDYFAVLGVPRESTGYEIKRAYLELRRAFDPARVLRPSLLELEPDLRLVLSVVDEAYEILKDPTRRERYRRAISHEPPQGP